MAETIINNMVTLTRGDTFERPLFLNKGTELKPIRYELKTDDKVYLAITEPNQPFECAIVKKTYGRENLNINGDIVIRLESQDTELLKPGQYYYTIKAEFVNNYKILNEDIIVSGETILKPQTRLTAGSTYQGHLIDIPKGEQYYVIPEGVELELSANDKIAKYSMIAYQSKINGEEVNTGSTINTVVPKTNFNIVE